MTTTTNIKLSKPGLGDNVNTWWQDPVNNNSDILDAITGSVTSLNLGSPSNDITLNDAQSRVSIIRLSGTQVRSMGISVSVIKTWIIENNAVSSGGLYPIFSNGSSNIGIPRGSSMIRSDGTTLSFVNMSPQIGGYLDWGGSILAMNWNGLCTVPPFLYCDGSTFNTTTYPLLFDVMGTNVLPDFRGRLGAYIDTSGANRITSAGSGINGALLGSAGGFQNITLDTTMMPVHNHTASGSSSPHSHNYTDPTIGSNNVPSSAPGSTTTWIPTVNGGTTTSTTVAVGVTVDFAGSGLAHNNMPPTVMGGYRFIRAA